ncbi:M15 family metallopeptidase domain-containing protein [Sulfuricaulis sp.]
MQQQAQCLADKITSVGISYPGPTATVRTSAYQAHLREIWEKLIELEKEKDPTIRQACASRKAEIENHKRSHGLTDEPAESSRHETGEAVDVGNEVIRELINRVTTDTSDVQNYINTPFANPPACNLRWGGRFRRRDSIHFQLP